MEKEFPQEIVVELEREKEASRIRRMVREAQEALRELRDDDHFVMPDSLPELTPDKSRAAYAPILAKIDAMIINEDDANEVMRKNKLRSKNERRMALCTININRVRALLDSPDLKGRYDQICDTVVPSASIDDVAARRVKKPVPNLAKEHWEMVCKMVESYNNLRQWEQKHDVNKKRLEILLTIDMKRFAEEWTCKGFTFPEDETEREKTIREQVQKTYL